MLVQFMNRHFLQYSEGTSKALLHPPYSGIVLTFGVGLRNWVKCVSINNLSVRDVWTDFPPEIQSFHVPVAQTERHDIRWREMETISCQLGLTSCLCGL